MNSILSLTMLILLGVCRLAGAAPVPLGLSIADSVENGPALAWEKMKPLSSIKSWQYHNWIDNRKGGGLRIGLRKFGDAEGDPHGKKPIWHLYKGLGTPNEEAAMPPYLKTIGIGSWVEVIHKGAIK